MSHRPHNRAIWNPKRLLRGSAQVGFPTTGTISQSPYLGLADAHTKEANVAAANRGNPFELTDHFDHFDRFDRRVISIGRAS
jgi:hypothetical protein